MPSSLGIKRAPFLVLGNFTTKLGLQKGKKSQLGGLVIFQKAALSNVGAFTIDQVFGVQEIKVWLYEATPILISGHSSGLYIKSKPQTVNP